MYQPSHFADHDPARLQAVVHRHPLATLVWQDASGALQADPVPLLWEPDGSTHGCLRGHVARANPLWREAPGAAEVLAVFQGPQAYISPSGYASKAEHGKVVPTWNYVVVQARGPLRSIGDAAWLRALVGRLTDRFEAPRPQPWQVDDAPAAYVDSMLRAIVGIEIPISAVVGKWKLSQNRSAADRAGVVADLRRTAADGEGDAMGNAMGNAIERASPG